MDDSTTDLPQIYAVYVQTVGTNEAKRLQANTIYFGFSGALIAAYVAAPDSLQHIIGLVGFVLSLVWLFTIKYHRDLARAKFKVINNIESHFKIQPFCDEWNEFKKLKWRIGLTEIEFIIPFALGIASLAMMVF